MSQAVCPSVPKNLPKPPTIMAGGGPYYEEIGPSKNEVITKIVNRIIKDSPKLGSLDLRAIVDNVVKDTTLGSYRGYYTFLHNNFVEDVQMLAMLQYRERHERNMRWWYGISLLKGVVGNYITRKKHNKLESN
jgi:hypothetical protein